MACAKHLLLPCIPLAPGSDRRLGVLAPKAAEAPHGIQETIPAQGSRPGSWCGQTDAAFTQEWATDVVPAPLRPTPPMHPTASWSSEVLGGPTAECCNVH